MNDDNHKKWENINRNGRGWNEKPKVFIFDHSSNKSAFVLG
jgi:hypothetical protein